MADDLLSVQEQDIFDPVSELAGTVEITFNAKNPKLDPYEPIMEQVVLTIGKSGRANRLTFDETTSESIEQVIEAFEKVKAEIEAIEEEAETDTEPVELEELESEKDSKRGEMKEVIKRCSGEEDSAPIDLVVKEFQRDPGFDEETAKDLLEKIKREGEAFEPENGRITLL